ncbi:MAG: SLC13 family permease [Steroidobacteraceae bacterium]
MIPLQQLLFLLILAAALFLFIRGKPRIDVTAMLVLLSLVVAGILDPDQALAGFASEPAIIVASVFVLSAGLGATGVTERIGQWIGRASGSREWRALLVIMPTVAVLAAFSHHLMVTAMMLPIVMRFSRDHGLPASRLLLPMSLAASLGTTLTLFSAPAFLLADDLLERQTPHGLDIFSLTPIGAALVVTGVLYVLLMRWILPRRSGEDPDHDYLRLEQYYVELVVTPDSRWAGQSERDFRKHFRNRLELVGWLRHGFRLTDPEQPLLAEDILLVRASPDEMSSLMEEPGLELNALAKYRKSDVLARPAGNARNGQLVQVVVAPGSEFAGRTVRDIDFLRNFGVLVVGLRRRESWIAEKISRIRLQEGDLLVLSGDADRYKELSQHHGFLMMMPFNSVPRWRHRAPLALGIMAAVVAVAATGITSAAIVFLAGAVAMVLTRCVTVEQAYNEIDTRVFVMIAGVIPLGTAMEITGTAQMLADHVFNFAGGWTTLAMLALMFISASLLTQVLSDSATVVLLGPIAIGFADRVGLTPVPFVVCAAIGAVASFLTPIGHHGNLLILGPGRYSFGDFLRVGLPLTVIICALTCWMAQAIWLGGPWIPSWIGG